MIDRGHLERYAGQQPWESGGFRFRPPTQQEFLHFDARGFYFVALQPVTMDRVVEGSPDRFIEGTLKHIYSASGPNLTERPAPPIIAGVNPELWLGSEYSYQPENKASLLRILEEANQTGRTDRVLGTRGNMTTLVAKTRFPDAAFVMGNASMYAQTAVALGNNEKPVVVFDEQFTVTLDDSEDHRGYEVLIGSSIWTEPRNSRVSSNQWGARPLRKLVVMGYDFIPQSLVYDIGDHRPQKQLLPLLVFVEETGKNLPGDVLQTGLSGLTGRQ